MNHLSDEEMAREVAADLLEGQYVNLGIGLPTLVAGAIPLDKEVILHSENGILGLGPRPEPGTEDGDLVDAGKIPVTLVRGGSYVSHVDSFCIIRGRHLDVAVLGAFEVSVRGDLANWTTGRGMPSVGGAMDLAVGAKSVFAIMRHTDKSGNHKLVEQLSLPVTGCGIVTRIYTDLGIFEPSSGGFRALGVTSGTTLDEIAEETTAAKISERSTRIIDHGSNSMEDKKREGYF